LYVTQECAIYCAKGVQLPVRILSPLDEAGKLCSFGTVQPNTT